ncbi:MAG TPA: hypothetical protein PKJ41_04625 [Bryobacteraceae bacterium]|nr:hypothetical protein [Bryobacteraceae bacterium]HPT27212.1 hypothetical protein [Bryobacteraceae bacterium]
MFPFVDGFHWSFGHILFLSVFGGVLALIGITLMVSLRRSARAALSGQSEAIRWKSDFHDLAANELSCRHELAGRVEHRHCHNEFDCRKCETHPKLANAAATSEFDVSTYGLSYPSDRLYHRGQTWVKREDDGTLTVGLTDLGQRLMGRPDSVELPAAGELLHANGQGWTMMRNGARVRLLSPVDGEVLEAGGPDQDFYLRIKPAGAQANLTHLLRGAEVSGWVRSQLERLQILTTPEGAKPSLADGGVLMEDLPKAQPDADWDKVYGEMFLEP